MTLRVPALVALLVATWGCSDPPPPPPPGDGAAGTGDLSSGRELGGAPDLVTESDGRVSSDGSTAPPPIDEIDDLRLAIIVGDSVGAGYNAAGRNGAGGRGFARLMVTNHADFPRYGRHDLSTRFPGVSFRDVTHSGAQSGEVLGDLRAALAGGLPGSVPGDVLVMINVGGNDFNDHIDTMIDAAKTQAAALKLRQNLAEMVRLLRARYEDRAAGKTVVFLIDNIHDPTDGMASVPPQFSDGFCKLIQNPLLVPFRMQVLRNLSTMNREIAAEVAARGAFFIDIHAAFLGHGMNSGAARFIDKDCVHPMSQGHDLIRQVAWQALTGERF